ncbi:I78 family peptidase inhibitor [Sphingomonas montana]|uniref:I78 family peptidase inhibitor n=1 Tax=Sphingomonas montana TaxID=1843236 RepID=UPI00096E0048|nr:I78 family peptidase inhibitor [Sphingomonas montana]
MNTRPFERAGALLGLTVLSACAGSGDHAGAATCRAGVAKALVGRPAPDDAAILRQTGAATVRRLAPGDMATQDYRADRVTVTIAAGRVISASCG